MINDDLNRNDLTRDNLDRVERPGGLSTRTMGLIAAVAVFAVLFMWAPWSPKILAENTAPGTTVGSATRPQTSVVPDVPTAPGAPGTTR
jgi:hypothetical protein